MKPYLAIFTLYTIATAIVSSIHTQPISQNQSDSESKTNSKTAQNEAKGPKIREKIKIGLKDPSLKACFRIFEFLDQNELKEFINEQGLDKFEYEEDRKPILQKFFGNAYYSCLIIAKRVGTDFFIEDFDKFSQNKEGRTFLTRKYIKWDTNIIKKGQMESTGQEDHAYKILSYFKHLYSQGKTVKMKKINTEFIDNSIINSKGVGDFIEHLFSYMSHTIGGFGIAIVLMSIILFFSKLNKKKYKIYQFIQNVFGTTLVNQNQTPIQKKHQLTTKQ